MSTSREHQKYVYFETLTVPILWTSQRCSSYECSLSSLSGGEEVVVAESDHSCRRWPLLLNGEGWSGH